jgi:hypothetical protein
MPLGTMLVVIVATKDNATHTHTHTCTVLCVAKEEMEEIWLAGLKLKLFNAA